MQVGGQRQEEGLAAAAAVWYLAALLLAAACSSPAPRPRPCSLAAEGLGAFKRDWRYRCYIASGELDGLEVLLGTARRQVAALQARFDRARELDERLEAAGLPLGSETWEMCKWIDLGVRGQGWRPGKGEKDVT